MVFRSLILQLSSSLAPTRSTIDHSKMAMFNENPLRSRLVGFLKNRLRYSVFNLIWLL